MLKINPSIGGKMINKAQIKIDYDRSIISISSSILKHFKVNNSYKTLPELDEILAQDYQNVVLMIIDGMGIELIKRHLPEGSFLRQHLISNISSVFPPTTTAATTAYHSGLPPISSGWLGWMNYYPQYDKIIETFLNREFYNGKPITEPAPSEVLINYETIYSKIQKANPQVEYCKIFPAFDQNGCQSFEEECERLVACQQSNNKKKIISMYWTEPDHSTHIYGVDSEETHQVMLDINQTLENTVSKLKNTVLIISADHGLINTQNIMLNEYPDLCEMFIRPPSLEVRFLTFFIKPEYHDSFPRVFEKYFSEDFVLYEKQEFLRSGILGKGKQHPLVDGFLGDFIAIGTGKRHLQYTTGERGPVIFKADHAGFSAAEMMVPLIIYQSK